MMNVGDYIGQWVNPSNLIRIPFPFQPPVKMLDLGDDLRDDIIECGRIHCENCQLDPAIEAGCSEFNHQAIKLHGETLDFNV